MAAGADGGFEIFAEPSFCCEMSTALSSYAPPAHPYHNIPPGGRGAAGHGIPLQENRSVISHMTAVTPQHGKRITACSHCFQCTAPFESSMERTCHMTAAIHGSTTPSSVDLEQLQLSDAQRSVPNE